MNSLGAARSMAAQGAPARSAQRQAPPCQHGRNIAGPLPRPAPAAPHAPGRAARPAPQRASSADDPSASGERLGPNVAAGIRDVQQSLEWRTATVTRNDAVSLDGSQRLLHLSVPDDVSAPARARAGALVQSASPLGRGRSRARARQRRAGLRRGGPAQTRRLGARKAGLGGFGAGVGTGVPAGAAPAPVR